MNKKFFSSLLVNKWKLVVIGFLFLIFLFYLGAFLLWRLYILPPSDFPLNKIITIEEGNTLNMVAENFADKKLISSTFWFETVGWLLRADKKVKAGEYFFDKPLTAVQLMKDITSDSCQPELIKITIPEGFDLRDIASLFKAKGIWQDEELYQITGQPATENSLEGFLFPDTYFVPLNITPDSMVKIMRENFNDKTTPEMREKSIVTMASLLEKEASSEKDRKLISGILWKRLKAGMPLQVDAVFPYIIGKYSLQLTLDDLKFDSPYNTYLYKGLPPGPIANPGLVSLEAALNPTDSLFWYYLSDKQGVIHYSKNYDEHLFQKAQYLTK